jgi:phage protein U
MHIERDEYDFQFGSEEFDCLKRLVSTDEHLSTLLSRKTVKRRNEFTVGLDRVDSERLRSYLSQRLAQSGFKNDYSLTKQGELVEELRFYRP